MKRYDEKGNYKIYHRKDNKHWYKYEEEIEYKRIEISEKEYKEIKSLKKEIKKIIKEHYLYCSVSQNCSIREFKIKVDWHSISQYQKLSKNFIREFKDKVHWYQISIYQKLSENFIREFKNKVHWGCISQYQKLSENFIYEFKNKIHIERLINRKLITKKRLKELEFREKEKEYNSRTKCSRFELMEI